MEIITDTELEKISGGTAVTGPFFRYTMRKNDTLVSVAFRFGTSVAVLRQINGLKSNDFKPGMELFIPQN